MRVRISDAAEADLEEIGSSIAEDNLSRADSFVIELLERCHGLAEHSSRYPVVTTWNGHEIRRCPYGRYLIFYVFDAEVLEIVRIIHSARDYLRLLFPGD